MNGKWHSLKRREETIKVKGREAVKWIVKETHRGPMISYFPSSIGSF